MSKDRLTLDKRTRNALALMCSDMRNAAANPSSIATPVAGVPTAPQNSMARGPL